MDLPSIALQRAVEQLSRLPGVGKRSALRYAMHLLKMNGAEVQDFADAIVRLKTDVHHCHLCHNLSDSETCPICSSPKRQRSIVCVVENVQEVMAIENTQQYRGLYHVLGGIISPMDGIGPADLEIQSLVERVEAGGINEVILALSPTMEGDTTNFYIYRKIRDTGVRVTVIARGVAQNDELQYTDEVTLGRALMGRTLFG